MTTIIGPFEIVYVLVCALVFLLWIAGAALTLWIFWNIPKRLAEIRDEIRLLRSDAGALNKSGLQYAADSHQAQTPQGQGTQSQVSRHAAQTPEAAPAVPREDLKYVPKS